MTRYLAPLAVVFALATTAQAQNYVTQSQTTVDGYGNSVTTTVQAPSSAVGLIANQAFNSGGYVSGGFSSGYVNGGFGVQYGGSVPTYYGNYPSGYYGGGYGGYAGYPNYGYNQGYYGNYPVYQSYSPPCPPTYVLPNRPTYVRPAPNQAPRTYVPGQPNRSLPAGTVYGAMAITPNPQGAPYTSKPYDYGWNSRQDGGPRRGRNR